MGADAGLREAAEAALLTLTEQQSLGGLCRGICAGVFPGALLGTLEDELEHAHGLPTSQVPPHPQYSLLYLHGILIRARHMQTLCPIRRYVVVHGLLALVGVG